LDRNQRQSRAKERMLGRNIACPRENAQPRGGYGGDHMKEEGNKSCGELKTTVENTGDQVYLAKIRQV